MRATNLGGQIVSSIALLSFMAGTCAQRDGNQGALGRHRSLAEEEATNQDVMYGAGLVKADINPPLSSDEMPRSTTSTKTTFYFTRSHSLSATPTTLLSSSPTESFSSDGNGKSSSYGQTSDISTEQSSKSFGETTNAATQANLTSTTFSETWTSTLSSVSTETLTLKSTTNQHRTSSKHHHKPSRSSGDLVTSTETVVTISTSTSLIYTNMTLPEPGTSMPGGKSSTMSMNFTVHNSFTSQLPTFSPSETSALPNFTSTSTLSYTSTLTFTSQASVSSKISSTKPHGASHSLPTSFPLSNSTIYSTTTSLETVAVSTSVDTSSTPLFPQTNATLVSGPTAISNTGTGVTQAPSTSTWLVVNGTISSNSPFSSINATSVTAGTGFGNGPATTITVPLVFTPLPSFNLTTIPLVTGTGNKTSGTVLGSAPAWSNSSSTETLIGTVEVTLTVPPPTTAATWTGGPIVSNISASLLPGTHSMSTRVSTMLPPPGTGTRKHSSKLTSTVSPAGTGGTVSSELSSARPYPVTNSSSFSQTAFGSSIFSLSSAGAISGSGSLPPTVTPFLTTTFSLPYQASKTIVQSFTVNTSCIETATTTETDTSLFTSVTLVMSTETHHKHHSTTKSGTRKHEATSVSVSNSNLPCCMSSSEPVFSSETSTSASSRHQQFSTPTWLIHSVDPTTFVTETSCISDFAPAASKTSMESAEEQRNDNPAGMAPIENVVSPDSVPDQHDYVKDTWAQRFKRKLDKALASFGYGGRTTGDGWP